jgi:hypothetical protein
MGEVTDTLSTVHGVLSESYRNWVACFVSVRVCFRSRLRNFAGGWAWDQVGCFACFANIFVAWAFVHQFAFFGKGRGSDHGELIVLYLGAPLIAGPGAASLDRLLARKP